MLIGSTTGLKNNLIFRYQKRRSLRKGLENIKAHLKLSFVRDKYIPLKREYIKSLNGRSNVQLMVAKYELGGHTLSFMIRINLHRLVRFSLFVDAIIPKKLMIFGLFIYLFLI
jgi:hypothetical protein